MLTPVVSCQADYNLFTMPRKPSSCRNVASKEVLVTKNEEAFAMKQNHLSIAELYIDVMESSDHPYWRTMKIYPSDWKHAARSYEASDRLDKSVVQWQAELSKFPGPSSTYLCEFGLRHCQSAAEKQSMSDPLWHRFIERVLMEPKSALAFNPE